MAKGIFNPVLQNSLQITKRRAWIEIYNPLVEDEKISFEKVEGLNVTFDVQSFGSHFPQANITVSNLNQEHIDRLLNFCNLQGAIYQKKIIRLYVGYNETAVCIFEGYIFDTKLSSPPDIQFSFTALLRGDILSKNINISLTNQVTLRQIFEEVAKQMDIQLDYQTTVEKTVKSFVANKSTPALLEDLRNLDSRVSFHLTNTYQNTAKGILRVYDTPETKDSTLPPWSKNYKISANTGLLGTPEFTVIGANLRTKLNPNYTMLDTVEVNSIYQKAGNGKYIILKVHHIGELRGNNFETRLFCRYLGDRMSEINKKTN